MAKSLEEQDPPPFLDDVARMMRITPLPSQWDGGTVTRSCHVTLYEDGQEAWQETLWYTFEIAPEHCPEDAHCDAYLITMLLDAMTYGADVEVDGYVSSGLLENLYEFQAIWARWAPHRVTPVGVRVASEVSVSPANQDAMVAFSGGLDAMFTTWRHAKKLCGPRSQNVRYAIMVNGFDIPLEAEDRFNYALSRAGAALEDLNISVKTIATNFRSFSKLSWHYTHGAALIAAMSHYSSLAGRCLLGSSHVYERLRFYGSSPISDPFLGSDGMKIMHDGCSHSRTEKADVVNDWHAGTENLRVCWQGEAFGNCGKCEKCIRTSLNFISNGHEVPGALKETVDLSQLRKVTVYNIGYIRMWQQLIDTAKRNGIDAPWVRRVRFVVLKSRLRLCLKGPS